MIALYYTTVAGLIVLTDNTKTRIATLRDRDDRGSLTVEQVVVTSVVLGLVLLVGAAITAAVNKRLPLIQ